MNDFLTSELVLYFNTEWSDTLRVGQPAFFLENASASVLFEEPCRFLWHRYVSAARSPSAHTWAKAAYSLKIWFQYLQAAGVHWQEADLATRRAFRDAYASSISPRTGQPYELGGIADSMTTVKQFYVYAGAEGFYEGELAIQNDLPGKDERRRGFKTDQDLPKQRPNVNIRALTPRELGNFLHYVGPQAGIRGNDKRHARDRLICDLGWVVGLRLSEVISLTTLQFLSITPDSKSPYADLHLVITGKGNKTRQVAIPTWLVIDALKYIEEDRAIALRASPVHIMKRPHQLFLSRQDSPRRGRPISSDAIQKMVREACIALGYTTTISKTCPDTGNTSLASVPKYSFHDLRHTYAVLTYHAEVANGNLEPWKKIQAQLGHAHLDITINTYLSHVEIFSQKTGLLNVRELIGL